MNRRNFNRALAASAAPLLEKAANEPIPSEKSTT